MLTSCSNELAYEEFIRWNKNAENGLTAEAKAGDFHFKAMYQPQEWVALKNHKKGLPTLTVWEEEMREHENFQYFNVQISAPGKPNFLKASLRRENEYYERLAYFSSFAQNDFSLVEGKDTLPCTMYHMERNYGIQPFQTLLLGFKNTPNQETQDKELIFQDRILGIEPVHFTIAKNNLQQIPKLKF